RQPARFRQDRQGRPGSAARERRVNYSAWRYYGRFYRGRHRALLLAVVVAAAQSAALLPIPLLVRFAFEEAIPARRLGLLAAAGAVALGLYVLNGAALLWARRV